MGITWEQAGNMFQQVSIAVPVRYGDSPYHMSIRAMSSVWEDDSITSRSELLLLLAIADFSNDKGVAWPSIETLAKKARQSQRATQTTVAGLVSAGKLSVDLNAGPKGVNIYRLILGGVQDLHPATSVLVVAEEVRGAGSGSPVAPKPSGTVIEPSGSSGDESPHASFVRSWCDSWEVQFGDRYPFVGGRDGNLVKTLLATTKLSAPDLMKLATQAWTKGQDEKKFWACSKARSIKGFLTHFVDIRAELSRAGQSGSPSAFADKDVFNPDTHKNYAG